ncbi:transposable element Tcb1 transposase [Trichonephila clavipes]|nr:transposable element Tcb1 transposase [Trichonephila clavipes]
MPPQRKKKKSQQLTEFDRERIIDICKGRFSYHAIGAHVQRNISTVKQWEAHQSPAKRVPLYRIALTVNHRWPRRQWAHDHRAWQAEWHEVVFSDVNHSSNLLGHVLVVVLEGAISYHGQSNLIRIDGNLKSNRYVHEVLKPEVVPFLQGIPGAIIQQDNARPLVANTFRDFCSSQHMQLQPWPAYSLYIMSIEHVGEFGWSASRLRSASCNFKRTFAEHILAIWSSLPQADIQNLFDSMPRRIATLIAARTKNSEAQWLSGRALRFHTTGARFKPRTGQGRLIPSVGQ